MAQTSCPACLKIYNLEDKHSGIIFKCAKCLAILNELSEESIRTLKQDGTELRIDDGIPDDATVGAAGGVGFWSKADAASSFDVLIISIEE